MPDGIDPFTMPNLKLYAMTGAFNESCTALLKVQTAQFDTELPADVYLYSLSLNAPDVGDITVLRMVEEYKPKLASIKSRNQKKKSNKK